MTDERFFPRTFAAIPEEYARWEAARVVILPVPYDNTASGLAGSREGPRAIIDASEEMELYDLELGLEPYRVGIHTLPEVVPHVGDPAAMMDRIEALVGELLDAGKFVATLGGEHTVAVGAVRAYRRRLPNLSVLALDAHADLRPEYLGTPYNHACTLRRVLELCPVVQVGLRSADRAEHEFIGERALPFFTVGAYRALADGPGEVVARLAADVYVTIDLDALDPAEMAAVGTPEPGGLRWEEVTALLARVASQRRIVGFDVTELAPRLGTFANAQLAAKLTYRLIGLALAAGP
jgi:agmatinase